MAQKGEVYRDTDTGLLSKVVAMPSRDSPGHMSDKTVELKKVEDGQWYSIFHDMFRHDFVKVADSVDDL